MFLIALEPFETQTPPMPSSNPMSRIRVSLAFLLVAASSTPLLAQKKASDSDPDMKAIAAYHLSMEKMNTLDHAMRDMAVELKKDPRFQKHMKEEAELSALQDKEDPTPADQKRIAELQAASDKFDAESADAMGNGESLAAMEAGIKKLTPLANALQKNGMSPREYAVFTMALLQAGMAAGFKKSGQLKTLPPGVNAENVQFVLDHEADIQRLQQSWASLATSK